MKMEKVQKYYANDNLRKGEKMEIDLSKEQICVNKLVCEKKEIVFIEEDMIVPDSKPDILNEIDLSGNVCIYKKEITDGKIKIDGSVNTYIMYLPDSKEDNLRGLNACIEFSKVVALPECKEGMQAVICVEIKDLECKVLNGRKINVRAGLEIKIKLYSNEEIDIINGINNIDDIQTLDKTFEVNSLIGTGNARVYVKDTLSIDPSDEIVEILKTDITLEDCDIKISYNKILSKCEVNVKIMYLTEDNRINTVQGKIPAVGFIDMPNVSEENICEINNEVNNIIVRPNSAEEHSIYVEIEIETSCTAFEKREIALIQDLYSPSQNLIFTQKRINVSEKKITQNKNFTVTSKTNIPDLVDGNMLDVEALCAINKEQKTNSTIMYEGEMTVNFIFSNNNGNVNSKISKIPFEFNMENVTENENANIETKLNILNKNFNIKQNGDVDCTLDVEALTEFTQNTNMNIIENIEIDENDADSGDYDSLIIYIVQKGDSLWKIAKKHRSTVDDISRVNGIDDPNQIQVGQKIYIPKFKNVSKKENVDVISA